MAEELEHRIQQLKESDKLPQHVAIIMDGNGRWAQKRDLPRLEGHSVGRESVRAVVRTCARIGIPYLTLYTFSLENWQRSADEVEGLMMLLEEVLRVEYEELNENGVQLRTIGRTDMAPAGTQASLAETMKKLAHNTRLVLTLAVSYGGRAELVDATRDIAREVKEGRLDLNAIDEKEFAKHLYDPSLPDPDLLVRTSGELRISNFLLWQLAYAEIYVTDTLWPDFREEALCDAVDAYTARERRFGL